MNKLRRYENETVANIVRNLSYVEVMPDTVNQVIDKTLELFGDEYNPIILAYTILGEYDFGNGEFGTDTLDDDCEWEEILEVVHKYWTGHKEDIDWSLCKNEYLNSDRF